MLQPAGKEEHHMDTNATILRNYSVSEGNGIKIATCTICRKQQVLRQGSNAITRLISHLATHGPVNIEMEKPLKK